MNGESKLGRRDFLRNSAAAAAGGAAILAVPPPAGASPVEIPAPLVHFREVQRIPVPLSKPAALAVADNGRLFVAGDNAVLEFSPEGREITRHTLAETPGSLAVLPDGQLLLGLRRRVATPEGSASAWTELDEHACITALTVSEEHVFVSDAGNRVVLCYDHTGRLLGRIGERDPKRDLPGLVVPSPYFDAAIDAMGALWVVNPGRHGLENYRPNGDLVSSWYRPGMDLNGFCGCCNPTHIAFRGSALVTAEKGLNRIKLYGPDTRLLGVIATPEDLQATETTSLNCAHEPPIRGLAVDSNNRIIALHARWKAIVIYEETAASAWRRGRHGACRQA